MSPARPRAGRYLRRNARYLLVVWGGCAIAGVVVGLLWVWLAPRELMKVYAGVAYPDTFQPRAFITADAVLVGLLALAGLAVTTVLLLRHRARPVRVLIASVIGGAIAGVIAWRLGEALGSVDVTALAKVADDGTRFYAGLRMRMWTDLLAWPIVAAFIVLLATLLDWWREPDPRSRRPR